MRKSRQQHKKEIGIPDSDLLDILASDKEKSASLAPLLIALRQRMDKTVRAPAEMMEVAKDICERVEKIEKIGPPPRRISDLAS